jgi:N-acetylglucosamine malate deacetylase 2
MIPFRPVGDLIAPLTVMLDWLDRSVAIVVAHPDDETIGVGAQLAHLRDPLIVHVTDGAPRRLGAAREDYARTRREELIAALRAGGAGSAQRRELGVADQEASLILTRIATMIEELLVGRRPEVVLTHPYEGGHPDHDATAFAVHAALGMMKRKGVTVPLLLEFTSYHAGESGMVTGEFLPADGCEENGVVLTAEAQQRKQWMFDCFVSQSDMLRNFAVTCERFRVAPSYDFAKPPHEGQLFYDRFDWGMTGSRWRTLAREALGLSAARST